MPWCDSCDRIVPDEELVEGGCPRCGTQIAETTKGPLPWRFRLMIAATAVYLAWRVWQGITWLSH